MSDIYSKNNILYRKWPAEDTSNITLLVHGLGGHSFRWQPLAEYFSNQGFSSYALELQGFGETSGQRGFVDGFGVYYKAISELYKTIQDENPGKPVYIAGESMGALISFIYSGNYTNNFNGLICISPAFASKIYFPLYVYFLLGSLLLINPRAMFDVPISSEAITRDKKWRQFLEEDELEVHKASVKLLVENLFARIASGKAALNLKLPVLFLLAGDDLIVKNEKSLDIFNKIRYSYKKLIEYPEMRHAMSIDKNREQVFNDVCCWIRSINDSGRLTPQV